MSAAHAERPRLRYVETTPQALGFPVDSVLTVHQVHLEGCRTLEEAVDVYRGVFGLRDGAGVTVTSDHGDTTIGPCGGMSLVKVPHDPRLLSADMVVHRRV